MTFSIFGKVVKGLEEYLFIHFFFENVDVENERFMFLRLNFIVIIVCLNSFFLAIYINHIYIENAGL